MDRGPTLRRRLGTGDAVMIGLGSMIGAGVFAAFAPAAAAAGGGLLIGLALAGAVAYCNAVASAQLAAARPASGGAYVHGRERLGPWWGFVAGWGFVVGKTASCAAMALTFAAYAAPDGWRRPAAVGAVVALAAVDHRGITRTAGLARILVVVVLGVLAAAVAAAALGGGTAGGVSPRPSGGPWGVLQAAGLLFFAFAGYARIATLGEEVRAPERTIPRAIVAALAVAVGVYGAVGAALLWALGPDRLAASAAPLDDAVQAAGAGWLSPAIVAGAAAAALGALLALLAGVGRTTLAMARTGDMPRPLAAVHPRHGVPHRAGAAVAAAACGLVLVGDLGAVIGFSSFGVLVYYLVANLAALRQPAAERRFPRVLQVAGVAGCGALAVTLPAPSVAAGVGVFAIGILWRAWRRHRGALTMT